MYLIQKDAMSHDAHLRGTENIKWLEIECFVPALTQTVTGH